MRDSARNEGGIELSHSAVERSLKNVKSGNAAGPDGLSGQIFKECYRELVSVSHSVSVVTELTSSSKIVKVFCHGTCT